MKTYTIQGSECVRHIVEAECPEQAERMLKSRLSRYLREARTALWAPFAEQTVKDDYYAEMSRLLRNGFRVVEIQERQCSAPRA